MTEDYILSRDEFALEILKEELKNRYNYKWTQANGQLISVKDMSDSHLKNAINKLSNFLEKQKNCTRELWTDVLNDYWG